VYIRRLQKHNPDSFPNAWTKTSSQNSIHTTIKQFMQSGRI